MRAIIFGANGQDGHYLGEVCKQNCIEPIKISRTGSGLKGDVSDYRIVKRLIKKYLPTHIFHMAANSTTHHDALFENHETISTGTINILESVKIYCPKAKVFITGSGVQFKNNGYPISENDPFEGSSPYSVARIQSVYAARYYRSLGIRTYVGYLFHHESCLRKEKHISQFIANAVKKISSGEKLIIEIGDIHVEKEWTYAGDMAKGIFTLINQDVIFEAAIGSGKTYTIENWLEECFNIIGEKWQKHVRIKSGFVSEYKRLISNPETINKLGWYPELTFPELSEKFVKGLF